LWENRVILAAHNEDINSLNNKILKFLEGEIHTYCSINFATHKGVDQTESDSHLNYPVEVLSQVREGLNQIKI